MILIFLLFPTLLFASDFKAEVKLSDTEITLLEPLIVTLTLTYPQDFTPNLEAIRNNLLLYSGFGTPPFTLEKEEISLPVLTFTLSPQTTGNFSLTFGAIPFTNAQGETKEAISPILPIKIGKEFIDTDYRGTPAPFLSFTPQLPLTVSPSNREHLIDGKKAIEKARQRNLQIFQGRRITWGEILLLLGTFALIWFFYFRKPKIPVKTQEQKLKEARERALSSLKILETSDFESLSDIIRRYISESYGVKMRTLTTQEFFEEMRERALFKEDTSRVLKDFLKVADRVKFAHYSPSAQDCEKARNSAKNFVETTSSRLLQIKS